MVVRKEEDYNRKFSFLKTSKNTKKDIYIHIYIYPYICILPAEAQIF